MILRPAPCTVVTIDEEKFEIEAHSGFGDQFTPPGAAKSIGDAVVHEATAFGKRLEAVLVHELRKGAFEHLIHQHSGRLHGVPATFPAHGNETPIATVKLDQVVLLGGAVSLQAHELQRGRHNVDDVSRITVKREHDFRAGGKASAGTKVGCHDQAFITIRREWRNRWPQNKTTPIQISPKDIKEATLSGSPYTSEPMRN